MLEILQCLLETKTLYPLNISVRMMIVSRFYSILRLYFDILTWKGVFGIFDNIVDPLSQKPWLVLNNI